MTYAKTTLREEDKLGANVVECLMCDFEPDLGKLRGAGFDIGFLVGRNDRLAELVNDEVETITEGRIVVSQSALFVVRGVAAASDAHGGEVARTNGKAA
ncbi:hypothetical protein [Rhizobium brockwellii]